MSCSLQLSVVPVGEAQHDCSLAVEVRLATFEMSVVEWQQAQWQRRRMVWRQQVVAGRPAIPRTDQA